MRAYQIGDRIHYRVIYDGKASKRFKDSRPSLSQALWSLTPLGVPPGEATVTGITRRVMSDFWYDCGGFEEQTTAGGKTELLLLVRLKPNSVEKIVRMQDAELAG